MFVPPDQFKNVMRQFPAGVTIVTIKAGVIVHGLTVSAFSSVSATPPLISISINRNNHAHTLLEQSEAVFAVSILREDQAELSNRFAWMKEDRFGMGQWKTAVTGAPVLADALGWVDCTIYSRHVAGTHTIYIGEVQASHAVEQETQPLIYWNRSYRQIVPN